MLRIGIWRASQDTSLQRLWRRGMISATLLKDDAAAAPGRFERIMQQISLSNLVTRTTFPGRFADLDERVQTCLLDVFSPGQSLAVEDWAVSAGVTSLEWFQRLRVDFPLVEFVASDSTLYLLEARRGNEAYVLEPDGTPIQYTHPPFVVSLVQMNHWLYPFNRLVQRYAQRHWDQVAPQIQIPDFDGLEGDPVPVVQPLFTVRRLPVVHPLVLAARGESFRIRRHSVFSALSEPADIIRTMNIFNRTYFDDTRLREGIGAVEESLRPGGVWIVGRTIEEQPPRHNATVFRKRLNGWEPLLRIGNGSEIEPLIQCYAPSTES